jgi:Exosome component EXOSC1/CSL4
VHGTASLRCQECDRNDSIKLLLCVFHCNNIDCSHIFTQILHYLSISLYLFLCLSAFLSVCWSASLSLSLPLPPPSSLSLSEPGTGTYILNDVICASVVGAKQIAKLSDSKSKSLPVLSVQQHKSPSLVPKIGDIITAKVTKINARVATVEIWTVGSRLLTETSIGSIR